CSEAAGDSVATTSKRASEDSPRCCRTGPARGPVNAASKPAAPAAPLRPVRTPHALSSAVAVVAQESSMARQQLTPAHKFGNAVSDTGPPCRPPTPAPPWAETAIGSPAASAAIPQAAVSGSTTTTRAERPRLVDLAQLVPADANPPTPACTATASIRSSPARESCCSISAKAVV